MAVGVVYMALPSALLFRRFISFPLSLFSPMEVGRNANQSLLFLWLQDRGQFQSFSYRGVWDALGLELGVGGEGEGAYLPALFAQLTPFWIAPTESPVECSRGCLCLGRCFLLTQSAFSFAHHEA